MGCVLTKEDYEEDLKKYKLERKYSPSFSIQDLPIIEPIKTKKIIYEEKIKTIYYIEYNKQNERRYKG